MNKPLSRRNHLTRLIRNFRHRSVGVLGDFMLDELLRGEVSRISPEAPVPVVFMGERQEAAGFPGGAGNVAANICALGGRAVPFGAIGADEAGRKLLALLRGRGIPSATLLVEPGRVTPVKMRVVARQQQLLRLDFEKPQRLSTRAQQKLARSLMRWMERLDALIVSDYQKGSVTMALWSKVLPVARQKRIPTFVDPKPELPEICRHSTLAAPNLQEAETLAGMSLRERRGRELGGRRLLAELGCAFLLITRGSEGMTLFEAGGGTHEIPSVPRPVYDVTGAGDTVIAVMALAYSSGSTMKEAAELANLAGGRVVLKFGTAEISAPELLDAVRENAAREKPRQATQKTE